MESFLYWPIDPDGDTILKPELVFRYHMLRYLLGVFKNWYYFVYVCISINQLTSLRVSDYVNRNI